MCLDGVDSRLQSGKADHGSKHHVNRLCLDNLAQSLCAGIYLDVRAVPKQRHKFVILLLIGNHHCRRLELTCLFGKQFHLIIRCKTVSLKTIAVLLNHFKSLCAYRTRTAKYAYLLFLHIVC